MSRKTFTRDRRRIRTVYTRFTTGALGCRVSHSTGKLDGLLKLRSLYNRGRWRHRRRTERDHARKAVNNARAKLVWKTSRTVSVRKCWRFRACFIVSNCRELFSYFLNNDYVVGVVSRRSSGERTRIVFSTLINKLLKSRVTIPVYGGL